MSTTVFITEFNANNGSGGMSYHLTKEESDAYIERIKEAYKGKATITRHGVFLDDLVNDWLENYNSQFDDAPDLYIEGKR